MKGGLSDQSSLYGGMRARRMCRPRCNMASWPFFYETGALAMCILDFLFGIHVNPRKPWPVSFFFEVWPVRLGLSYIIRSIQDTKCLD